jgi:hypothetical protein
MDDQFEPATDAIATASEQKKRKPRRRVQQQAGHPGVEPLAYKIRGTAKVLNLGITTTKELVYSGQIYSMKVGNVRLIPLWAIKKFLGEKNV